MAGRGPPKPAGTGAVGHSLEGEGICERGGLPVVSLVADASSCVVTGAHFLLLKSFWKVFFTSPSPNSVPPYVGFRRPQRNPGVQQGAIKLHLNIQVPWFMIHTVVRRLYGLGSDRIPGQSRGQGKLHMFVI